MSLSLGAYMQASWRSPSTRGTAKHLVQASVKLGTVSTADSDASSPGWSAVSPVSHWGCPPQGSQFTLGWLCLWWQSHCNPNWGWQETAQEAGSREMALTRLPRSVLSGPWPVSFQSHPVETLAVAWQPSSRMPFFKGQLARRSCPGRPFPPTSVLEDALLHVLPGEELKQRTGQAFYSSWSQGSPQGQADNPSPVTAHRKSLAKLPHCLNSPSLSLLRHEVGIMK